MKLFSIVLLTSQVNGVCKIKVESREDCQAVCDHASNCEAWTFKKTDETTCLLKGRYGWSHQACQNCDSGFKDQGPWYEANTDFEGGDVDCV